MSVSEAPLISIVTACYNSTPFLKRVHQSLAAQSLKDFEWVCVDDRSTDDTVALLSRLPSPGDGGMQVYQLPQNTGGPVAQAVGTSHARGRVVVWLDHDDELTPFAMEQVRSNWESIKADDDVCAVFHRATNPVDGSLIGLELAPHSRFTSSKLTNLHPDVSDGLMAFKAEAIRRFATVETMEPVALNGSLMMEMTNDMAFVVAEGPPIKYYHRDNPDSQTRNERISRKYVHSYARILDRADRYALGNPLRWISHTATMLRYSKQVHGRFLEPLRYMRHVVPKLLTIACLPLGWIADRRKKAPNVVEIPYFRPEQANGLPDLWRGRIE